VDEEDTEDTKIYLYAGGDESDTMIEHVKNFKGAIASEFVKDKMKINLSINKEGKHNETYWVTNFLKLLSGFF
jgi:hypothetical protein